MKLISVTDFQEMAWKNGQGMTSQIEIFPPAAEFAKNNFEWRISQAKITGSNSFSIFPGYDRCLTILSGDGVKLNNDTLHVGHVHRFHGEELIQCSLLGAAVVDLGVIYKRDSYNCEMRVEHFNASKKINFQNNGVHFIKSLSQKNILRAEGSGDLSLSGLIVSGQTVIISLFKIN